MALPNLLTARVLSTEEYAGYMQFRDYSRKGKGQGNIAVAGFVPARNRATLAVAPVIYYMSSLRQSGSV